MRRLVVKKKVILPIITSVLVLAIIVVGFVFVSMQAICGEWKFQYIIDDKGNIIACCEEELDTYKDAKKSNMTLSVGKGTITMKDDSNEWKGSYRFNKSNLAGSIYEIEMIEDGTIYDALAVVGSKLVSDAKGEDVLNISIVYNKKTYGLFFEK